MPSPNFAEVGRAEAVAWSVDDADGELVEALAVVTDKDVAAVALAKVLAEDEEEVVDEVADEVVIASSEVMLKKTVLSLAVSAPVT